MLSSHQKITDCRLDLLLQFTNFLYFIIICTNIQVTVLSSQSRTHDIASAFCQLENAASGICGTYKQNLSHRASSCPLAELLDFCVRARYNWIQQTVPQLDLNEGIHMVNYGLTDRVALITGANNPQGIGAATALAFAREGAKVVLVYKKVFRPFDPNKTDKNGPDRYYAANAGSADLVENQLREMNADYLILESDISSEDAVKKIYSTVLERYGRIDILVNNAAVDDENGYDTIEKITPAVIDDTFAVNVRGSILMIRELVNHRGDYGRIINLSTDAAQIFAGQITYGASKATLEALTRSIALEVAPYGITVNCVAPGPTQTGWIDGDLEAAVLPLIPMGKLITPEDIAETILFLASQQAGMLTGQVLKVSGGHAL